MELFNMLSEILLPIIFVVFIVALVGGLVWDAASKKNK